MGKRYSMLEGTDKDTNAQEKKANIPDVEKIKRDNNIIKIFEGVASKEGNTGKSDKTTEKK